MDELTRFYIVVFGFLGIYLLFILSRFLPKSYIALIFCASVLYQGFEASDYRAQVLWIIPVWVCLDTWNRIKKKKKSPSDSETIQGEKEETKISTMEMIGQLEIEHSNLNQKVEPE